MKPLRPHNYYGGTTCPGRVTGQVSTIRSLIPEEDDMSYPLKSIQKKSGGAVYVTNGIYKWGVTTSAMWTELKQAGLVEPRQLTKVSDSLWERIRNRPVALTRAEITAACKAAIPAGASVDVPAIAKAVADEQARRMRG